MSKNKNKQTKKAFDLENELTFARRMDNYGVRDGHGHTALFKMDNQQRPTVGNSAQCYVPAWMEQGLGENGYMYMSG